MNFSEHPDAPDIESSTQAYSSRFSGDVGAWFLEIQSDITRRILTSLSHRLGRPLKVLDAGGGHGQNVDVVLKGGHSLTILGSNENCSQLLPDTVSGELKFVVGSLSSMPFNDAEFDLVLSYRIMAHIADWKGYLKELARVSRYTVAIDYPTFRSFNSLSVLLYRFKKNIEKNTREFRLFSDKELRSALQSSGLKPSKKYPQFFFPMALHRALQNVLIARMLEGLASSLLLRYFFGSPIIASYDVANFESDGD